jgi:hypothetical protein
MHALAQYIALNKIYRTWTLNISVASVGVVLDAARHHRTYIYRYRQTCHITPVPEDKPGMSLTWTNT